MKAKGTISICAKCSDMFGAVVYDENHKEILDYDGYVPSFFPGQHFRDYVMLDIDLETGKILNWEAPTVAQLQEMKDRE
jgi:hypothetical protein